MSGWSCPHEVEGLCERVRGACCRPGMRGCVLAGRVEFPDGVIPGPEWPSRTERHRTPEDEPAPPEDAPEAHDSREEG